MEGNEKQIKISTSHKKCDHFLMYTYSYALLRAPTDPMKPISIMHFRINQQSLQQLLFYSIATHFWYNESSFNHRSCARLIHSECFMCIEIIFNLHIFLHCKTIERVHHSLYILPLPFVNYFPVFVIVLHPTMHKKTIQRINRKQSQHKCTS